MRKQHNGSFVSHVCIGCAVRQEVTAPRTCITCHLTVCQHIDEAPLLPSETRCDYHLAAQQHGAKFVLESGNN